MQTSQYSEEPEPIPKSNVTTRWTKPALDEVVRLVDQTLGLDVSRYDESFLAVSLEKRQSATEIDITQRYIERVAVDREEALVLYDSLNIGYSEFFRSPLTFSLLEQLVLPSLIHDRERSGRGEIRIWSAGCAAGQEAYSVAILLEELAAERGVAIPYRIIASDVSDAQLAVARNGIYDDAAVRNVRLRHLARFFSAQGKSFAITSRLRDRVDFSIYNLLDERSISPPASIYGDFDIILCCNLLFYYRPDVRLHILGRLRRCLSPDGYLVTGEAERAMVQQSGGFRAMAPPAAVFRGQ
jgi:chemotaxis protein methyltransferase CheR